MKKCSIFSLILLLSFQLYACGTTPSVSEQPPQTTEDSKDTTLSEHPDDSEKPTVSHSPFYMERYSVEQVIEYFNEVVLNVEYGAGSGNHQAVKKWTERITYRLEGEATEKDLAVLEGFFAELNAIEGFPGIYLATENETAAMSIHFYNRHGFRNNMSQYIDNETADGAAVYWFYNDNNQIHTAKIGYRTDIKQTTRNSVLLEEIVNALGLGDSWLREDSIVYNGYSLPQKLSDMDWLILKLLYNANIKSGMSQNECEEIIKTLYY